MATYETLNKEQLAAITHGDGPLLIIAGAGTGKTTVITERIKHLILEKEISPHNILALTFTEKAAKEMEERIDVVMPYGYTDMWIATFHAFADRILRQNAIDIGLDPRYKMLTEAEAILFLKEHIFDLQLSYYRPLGNPNKFLQGLLQHFSRLKDEDITPKEYLAFVARTFPTTPDTPEEREEYKKLSELANAYLAYEELKAKEGIMDFGDLIANVLNLFRKRPNILKEYQRQFSYILIDEFQDTNYSQNQLVMLLAGEKKNVTVVGDDDQAIYRWRGAAISNMIQFRKHFPDVKIVTLTKNYRSTANILDTAYKAIQYNNPDRLEVKEKINKKLTAERKVMGEKVNFLLTDTVENEAEGVIETIIDLMKKKKYDYKDFAILVRANDHSQPFLRALERQRIPYQFLGPGQLFHQEEIKDLIAYLKALYNFEDSSSLYRVLTMPIFAVPATDIAAILNYAKKTNITLFKALQKTGDIDLTEECKEKIEKILLLLQKHLELVPKETAGQILYFFLEESGLLKGYLEVKNQKDELKAQNIAKFFEKLKSYENQHDNASVFAIVDWIDLSMQMGESPLAANIDWSENNAVNILTIHSSKGLEFPVVFITNLVTQRFPSRERKEQIPLRDDIVKEILPEGDFHLQEERRLFYVAMTRAKDTLYLTASHFYGEGKRERKVSPFVAEAIGTDEVEKAKLQLSKQKTQLSLIDIFPKIDTNITTDFIQQTPVTYLSYSQIQTFDTCPLHYKLKYLLKIPTPQSASQSFGTSVHSTLKEFYLRAVEGENMSTDDIEPILQSVWVPEGYASSSHQETAYQQALFLVTNYLKQNYNPHNLPIGLEIPFQFSVGKIKVGGRIDRIDRLDENHLEIIDYKTGNNLPSEKDIQKNFQLTLYGLAASEIRDPLYHRRPEEVMLSLYYLEEGKKFSTTRTLAQLEEAKNVILEKAEEVEKSDFLCNKSIICENCEYKMLCQTISGQPHN